jgi:hypothetical protein
MVAWFLPVAMVPSRITLGSTLPSPILSNQILLRNQLFRQPSPIVVMSRQTMKNIYYAKHVLEDDHLNLVVGPSIAAGLGDTLYLIDHGNVDRFRMQQDGEKATSVNWNKKGAASWPLE